MHTNDTPTTNKIVEPKRIHYAYCKLQRVLYGFIEMDVMCVRVVGLNEYKNLQSAYGSYYSSIKRLKIPVRVSIRKGEMYLFRTDKEAKMQELDTTAY